MNINPIMQLDRLVQLLHTDESLAVLVLFTLTGIVMTAGLSLLAPAWLMLTVALLAAAGVLWVCQHWSPR
jgi:hypothetical protein